MTENEKFGALLLFAYTLLVIAASVGVTYTIWQRDAVKQGVAEYDSVTGNWKWKSEKI